MLSAIVQALWFPEGPLTGRTTSYAAMNKRVHLTFQLKSNLSNELLQMGNNEITLSEENKQKMKVTCNLLLQNKKYD